MVICAHLLGLFCVWYFCPLYILVSKIYLYSYHVGFPNVFFVCGCFTSISLSHNFRCSRKNGMPTVCKSRRKSICLQSDLVQCTKCLIFATLLGISICIILRLGQYSMARFKFAFNADSTITMQVCTFKHELIYFIQAAISCNGGPWLQDI